MGKWKAIVMAIGLAALLAGCGERGEERGAGESSAPSRQASELPGTVSETAQTDWSEFAPTTATVSRSQKFGSVYPAVLGRFSEVEEVEAFVRAAENAKRIDGMLDVANPEYDLVLTDEGGEMRELHLWLGASEGKKGMYTFVSDTGTGFTIGEADADALRKLVGAIDYRSEQAAANGEIVRSPSGLANTDRWLDFLLDFGEGKPAEAHVVTYTDEGDPIFQDLLFEGGTIVYTTDTTMDKFGSPNRTRSFCKGIDNSKTERGTMYTLAQCEGDPANFSFELQMEND
ncbi:DUF4362 domain-containing protein [Cohnella suwonensis]|uniref:DUF4362 domain-containing protein n=1 Tax=Cohnella suwonensis TaxID=696072 RepID=A0ABW0LYC0_9BACL